MIEVIEVKNMEYVGEKVCTVNGKESKLRTMQLVDLNADRWNALAEKTNTRMFVKLTGREPVSYQEVRNWVNDLIAKEKAPAPTGACIVHAYA